MLAAVAVPRDEIDPPEDAALGEPGGEPVGVPATRGLAFGRVTTPGMSITSEDECGRGRRTPACSTACDDGGLFGRGCSIDIFDDAIRCRTGCHNLRLQWWPEPSAWTLQGENRKHNPAARSISRIFSTVANITRFSPHIAAGRG